MTVSHPETDILPLLRGELAPVSRVRVEAHVRDCPRCQATARAFQHLLDDLAASAPPPPAMDWSRWTLELRTKLRAPSGTGASRRPAWSWWRPVPVGLSAAMAGLLLFIAVHGVTRNGATTDLAVVDETIRAQRVEVLDQAPMLETLDLLEDLEVLRLLDRLAEARPGAHRAPRRQGIGTT